MNTLLVQHTKTFKRNILLGILTILCANLFIAQNKLSKLEKELSFTQIPLFKLNSSHTQIIFSPWDKNTISINAYSTGNVDIEYLQNINDLWEIQMQSSDSILILNTDASRQMPVKVITATSVSEVNPINVLLKSMLNDSKESSMPIVLQKRIAQLQFDFEAYNKEGAVYFKNWEQRLVKGLDDHSAKEVHNWSKQVSSKLVNPNTNNITEVDWSAKKTVVYQFYENTVDNPNIEVRKVIELKVPRATLSYFKTRYGSVNMTNTVTNIQAKLKYTPFKASHINGRFTNIKVISAPVQIDRWDIGKLQLQYVKSGEINTVNQIDLNINSSRFLIHSLKKKGIFKTNFSQLGVDYLSSNFSELSFTSYNSDVVMSLPKEAFDFVYSGEMSKIKMPPNTLELKSLGDFKNLMLHGFSRSQNSNKQIQMNVVNSQIILK